MSKYLEELPHEQAMNVWASERRLEPCGHFIATGDFMGMAKHNIACPVCFDAPAMLYRDVTPGKYRQTIQPCLICKQKGWVIARVPRWILRLFWWY